MQKGLRCFFAIFLFSIVTKTCSGNEIDSVQPSYISLTEKINSIPKSDRFFLEGFFSYLVRFEGLGFTLFGDKPVCLSGFFINLPVGNYLMGYNTFLLKKGWEVWKKYESLFPHPQYLIFDEQVQEIQNIRQIFIINKKKLIFSYHKHHSYFRKFLPISTGQNFLLEIEKKKSLLDVLNRHEGLLGILLGYGPESSMLYYKRDLYWKSQNPFTSREIELEPISTTPSPFDNYIYPISFVGKANSLEIREILLKNQRESELIHSIYGNGSILEITLKKLMET